MSSRRKSRARRRRFPRSLTSVALVLGATLLLFAMSWGANRVEQLRRQRNSLEQDQVYQQDEYRRLLASWLQATCRDQIVSRAARELEMVEADPQEKAVVVMRGTELDPERSGFLQQLAQGLDRYGQIRGAYAEEETP